MNKDQKRKQQLHEKAQNESLTFQTMYGARQKFGELTADIETRLSEKIIVFNQNRSIELKHYDSKGFLMTAIRKNFCKHKNVCKLQERPQIINI